MAFIQIRIDDELKEKATKLYDSLGLDLSTAIRMFLAQSVKENGIPFIASASQKKIIGLILKELIEESQRQSVINGTDKMTLDEINEEIRLTRIEIDKENK